MGRKITINLNTFGPRFDENQRVILLNKPKKSTFTGAHIHFIEVFEQFLGKDLESITKTDMKRYFEITDKETHLNITPSKEYSNVFNRIIQPLILGKKYYTFGEYLSCIALAGLSAEMMSLVVWKISKLKVAGQDINDETQKIVFGKIDQKRRIEMLKLFEVIDEDSEGMFEEIRTIRNKYIHSWDISSKQDKGNAKKVIRYALILFKNISGIAIEIDDKGDQKIKIDQRLLDFMDDEK